MILQGTVSSGGGEEWNGLSYKSIPPNKGMEDEVEYVNKESIIPDQMIGEELYGNTADEPCVESINSSQEEEGDGEGIIVLLVKPSFIQLNMSFFSL